jgi:FtsZ-binding cell division protein ZapB
MSTLKLTKEHKKYGKAGTIATVPFIEARELVKAGVAERYNGGQGPGAPEPPASVSMKKFEEAGKKITLLEAECKELADENRRLEAAAKKDGEAIEKLRAENERLAEELATIKKAAAK